MVGLIFGIPILLAFGVIVWKKSRGAKKQSTQNYGGRAPEVQLQAVQVNQVRYPNQQMGLPPQQGYAQGNPSYPQQQPMYGAMPGAPVVQIQGYLLFKQMPKRASKVLL